jgi:S1-C subfamily serine protease
MYDPTATGSTSTDAVAATDEQQVGVVTIVSTLYYDSDSQAAGTGIILSSTGEILTNNHVVAGATTIEVTVESTGVTYEAEVVGTDATADVAVLQLEDASGLTPATIDDSSSVAVADAVTSVGNAEGTGDLVAASGTVTALDESIEVGNEYTGATESLSDLIEIDADVVSGDSGGPLVDADGEVIGIVTAASSGTADITGYAIEIDTALAIVDQIEAGTASDTVVIGTPAFLGVTLADTTTTTPQTDTDAATGVVLGGVIDGLPAAEAGLVAGDTITAVDGTAVSNAESLSEIVASHQPGESVTITYLDASGDSHSVTVTLVEGPAA